MQKSPEFYESLAKRLYPNDVRKGAKVWFSRVASATRCWAAWDASRAFDHPVPDERLTAFDNRVRAFGRLIGFSQVKSLHMAKKLALVEQADRPDLHPDLYPELVEPVVDVPEPESEATNSGALDDEV